jgi:hypothetical protein
MYFNVNKTMADILYKDLFGIVGIIIATSHEAMKIAR